MANPFLELIKQEKERTNKKEQNPFLKIIEETKNKRLKRKETQGGLQTEPTLDLLEQNPFSRIIEEEKEQRARERVPLQVDRPLPLQDVPIFQEEEQPELTALDFEKEAKKLERPKPILSEELIQDPAFQQQPDIPPLQEQAPIFEDLPEEAVKTEDPTGELKPEVKEEVVRKAKGIASGAISSASSFASALKALEKKGPIKFSPNETQLLGQVAQKLVTELHIPDLGESVAEKLDSINEKFFKVEDPTFADKVAQGFGSSATFLIPSVGVARSTVVLAKVAPRIASYLGLGIATTMEAMVEAGSTYQESINRGNSHEESQKKAAFTFTANLPVNAVLGKWIFNKLPEGKTITNLIKGAGQEGAQEGIQEVIGNVAQGDPVLQNVPEAALVGSVIGSTIGGVKLGVETFKDLKTEEKTKEPPIKFETTEEAIAFGEKATKDQIEELKQERTNLEQQASSLIKEGETDPTKLQEGADVSVKAQLAKEAIDAFNAVTIPEQEVMIKKKPEKTPLPKKRTVPKEKAIDSPVQEKAKVTKEIKVRKEQEKKVPVERRKPDPAGFFEPQIDLGKQGEQGAILLSSEKGKKKSPTARKIDTFVKEFFTTKGLFPAEIFKEVEKRRFKINKAVRGIEFTLADFKRAKKEIEKIIPKLTFEQKLNIDSVLKKEGKLNPELEPIAPVIRKMREHIDTMSGLLIESGAIEGELAKIVDKQMGFYAARSYRVHDDPDHADKVPQDVRNRAKEFIRSDLTKDVFEFSRATGEIVGIGKKETFGIKLQDLDEIQKEKLIDQQKKRKDQIKRLRQQILEESPIAQFKRFVGKEAVFVPEENWSDWKPVIDKIGVKFFTKDKSKGSGIAIDSLAQEFGSQTRGVEYSEQELFNILDSAQPMTNDILKKVEPPKFIDKEGKEIIVKKPKQEEALESLKISEENIEGIIDELLFKFETGPAFTLSKGGKVGSKAMKILKRRKSIPVEIRALWGEYKDADVNYAKSVERMATLIANHQFLTKVKEIGKGRYFFDTPITKGDDKFVVQFASEGNKALSPLDGLYTTPEIKKAFETEFIQEQHPWWLRHYMKLNALVKLDKTVGSIGTHSANFFSGIGAATAQGHYRFDKLNIAAKTVWADVRNKSDEEYRAYILRLVKLGVLDESVRAGEIKDVINDATNKDIDKLLDKDKRGTLSAIPKIVINLYSAEDNFWRIFYFENEKANYGQAFPEWDQDRLEKEAAEITRDTYFTYTKIPKGIKALRRIPLIAPFTSFTSEVVRTSFKTINLIKTELKNPRTKAIGARRLAGTIIAASGTIAAGIATAFMAGVGGDEKKDLNNLQPDFYKNDQNLYFSKAPGNYGFVNISRVDPYNYLKKPIMAFLNNDDWETAILESTLELAGPFIQPDILAQKTFQLLKNENAFGKRIYNPQDSMGDKSADVINFLWEELGPGTANSIRRISKGFLPPKDFLYSKKYNPTEEFLSTFPGIRISELNVERALFFKAKEFKDKYRDASIAGEFEEIEPKRVAMIRVLEDMHDVIISTKKLGLTNSDVSRALKTAKVPKNVQRAFFSGEFENTVDRFIKKNRTKRR